MTDTDAILERLRTEAQLAKNGGHPILAGSFELAITEIERLSEDFARTARNRDMWKGQCERQADQLRAIPVRAIPTPSDLHELAYAPDGKEYRSMVFEEAAKRLPLEEEIGRLRAIVRVNGLRWGHSHAEIDALLSPQDGTVPRDEQARIELTRQAQELDMGYGTVPGAEKLAAEIYRAVYEANGHTLNRGEEIHNAIFKCLRSSGEPTYAMARLRVSRVLTKHADKLRDGDVGNLLDDLVALWEAE